MSQKTIAVVGASTNRAKFGNKAVRAYLKQGYQVFPVNPKGGEIEELTAYPRLLDVPVERLHRVSVYLPPEQTLALLDEVAAKGCDELWLNPGSESKEVLARAAELGLEPIMACSILDVGERPSAL